MMLVMIRVILSDLVGMVGKMIQSFALTMFYDFTMTLVFVCLYVVKIVDVFTVIILL